MDDNEHDLSHGMEANRRADKAELNLGRRPKSIAPGDTNYGAPDLTEFCQQHGVSEETVFAMEKAIGQLKEVLALRHRLPAETVAAIFDELIGVRGGVGSNATIDAARAIEARCRRGFNLLLAYQDRQRPKPLQPSMGGMYSKAQVEELTAAVFKESQMSFRALSLELGFTLAAGGDEPAKIARKFGYEKFTFCKCCEYFQKMLELPLRPGQRDEEARAKMAEARERQLESAELGGSATCDQRTAE